MEEKRKEGHLVVSQTDKSGKLTVSTMENYVLHGAKHVRGDKPIGWKEVKVIKKEVADHTKAITNIFQQGLDWGEKEEGRIRSAMAEKATVIPQINLTQKDHKVYE